MNKGNLVYEAGSNIKELTSLLERAEIKAKELDVLLDEINRFEVEINIDKDPKVTVKSN